MKHSHHPLLFIKGYRIISTPTENLSDLLSLCTKEAIGYTDVKIDTTRAELLTPFFSYRRLKRSADAAQIPLLLLGEYGLPSLILKKCKRGGIVLGILCSLLLIFFSTSVIFDVRIDNEGRLCEEEVSSLLRECGLSVGKFKRRLDIDVIENRVLIASDDISWISINIIGNVAKVEIRELDFAPDLKKDDLPPAANLVASKNGTVVGFEDIKGNLAVAIGENVSAGQLLVGGIFGDELRGFRYTAAEGRVFANTESDFSVSIPRKYQKKTYTGKEKCEKYLVFFEKEIKFFSNCRNLYPLYDKIEVVEYLYAPNGEKLPLGIRTVRYAEYTFYESERSESELKYLAEYRLNAILASYDGAILQKKTGYESNASEYKIICSADTIEDIAKMQEIQIQ